MPSKKRQRQFLRRALPAVASDRPLEEAAPLALPRDARERLQQARRRAAQLEMAWAMRQRYLAQGRKPPAGLRKHIRALLAGNVRQTDAGWQVARARPSNTPKKAPKKSGPFKPRIVSHRRVRGTGKHRKKATRGARGKREAKRKPKKR